jgi:anti-sigma B factor antagonist
VADDLLRLRREVDGERAVLHAAGELDETTSGTLVEACKPELDEGRSVLLDLDDVGFIGSAGVAALVQLHTHATALGLSFAITRPSRIVRRVLELVRLDGVLLEEH